MQLTNLFVGLWFLGVRIKLRDLELVEPPDASCSALIDVAASFPVSA